MEPQPLSAETTDGVSRSKGSKRSRKRLKAAGKSRRSSTTSSQLRAGRARAASQADVTGADETNFLTTASNADTLGRSIRLKSAGKSRRSSTAGSQPRAGRSRAPSQADVTGAEETNFLTTATNADTLGRSIRLKSAGKSRRSSTAGSQQRAGRSRAPSQADITGAYETAPNTETLRRSVQPEATQHDRRRPNRTRRSASSGTLTDLPSEAGQPSADQAEKSQSLSAAARRRSKNRPRLPLATQGINPPSQPESQLSVKSRQSGHTLEEAPSAPRRTSTQPQPVAAGQMRAEQESRAPGKPSAHTRTPEKSATAGGLAEPVVPDAARGNVPSQPPTSRRPSSHPKAEGYEGVDRRPSSGRLREKREVSSIAQPETAERALGEDAWSSSESCQTTQPLSPAFLLPHYEDKPAASRSARAWKRIRHAGGRLRKAGGRLRKTREVVEMHGLHYHLTASVVGVVLAAMIFIAVALGRLAPAEGRDNTCHTHECRDYARRLAMSLNTSVSACHSFTHFVCDGWQRDNRMSVKHDLDWQLLDRIERLVRRMHIPTTNQSEPQKAAAFYISCDDLVRGKRDDLAVVRAALAEAGITWPHRRESIDVVRLLLSATVKLGWDVYLRVVPGRFGGRDGALIDRGAFFGHVARRPAMQAADKEDYFNALRESFAGNATETGDNNTASFEETVAAEQLLMPILQKAYGEVRNPIELSPGTLSGSEWGLKELETRWRQTLEEVGFRMPADTNFYVARPAYVKTFARMWRLLGDANLYNVVSWGTIQVAALFANRNLTLNFYRGHQPFLNYGAFCLSAAYRLMGHALSRMYSAKVLTQHTLEGAKGITRRVREAVRQGLSSWRHYNDAIAVVADWTTLDTAFVAFSYTTNDRRVVQFDMSDSLVVNWQRAVRMADGNHWDVGAVDALASRQLSSLLPGHDFQLMPYSLSFLHYHPDLDAALNFGGLGTIVTQALGRLFVDAYAKGGPFSAFSDCILSGSFSRGQDVDITMAEVFAFSALVGAYKGAVGSGKSGIVDLKYNGLQLLFIAACYLKCKGSDAGNSDRLCDISFQHVPEFSEAFKCAPGTPLNPFNQCALPQK